MRRSEAIILLWALLALPAAAAAVAAKGEAEPARPPPRAAADPDNANKNKQDKTPGAEEALPSEADIRRAFDAADYKGALQMLSRVVNLRGEAGAAYDKHAMWMLKGESHLRLRQLKPAGEAFAAAARETDDPVQAATARATRKLIAEAKAFRVTRRMPAKGAKVKTADLLDPDQRPAALTILYEDERAVVRPKVEAALRSRALPPIAEALQMAQGLRDLELAATGGDADLTELRTDLADRATKLMGKELDRLSKDVEAIRQSAARPVERRRRRTTIYRGGYGGSSDTITSRPLGLRGDDVEDLRAIIEACRRIIDAAESLADASGGDVERATEVIDRATDVGAAAERVLDGRFEGGDN